MCTAESFRFKFFDDNVIVAYQHIYKRSVQLKGFEAE